jgi:hypothetical protein
MSNDAPKIAGVRDFVVKRLRNVGEDLASSGHPYRSAQLGYAADRIENPALARAVGSAASTVAGGVSSAVGTAIKPGDSAAGRWLVDKATTPLGAVVGLGALAWPLGAIHSFEDNRVLGPLSGGQLRGETPMTDPFHSFVQQRKHGHVPPPPAPRAKQASAGRMMGGFLGAAMDPLGEVLKKLIMRPQLDPLTKAPVMRAVTDAAGNTVQEAVQELSPGKAMLSGAGALGLGGLLGMTDPATETAAYQVQKMLFPAHERVRAEDEIVKNFASQAGKNTADALNDLLIGAMGGAVGAARGMNTSFSQDAVFSKALESDPLLRDATPQDRQMLQQAFGSMARFAPQVATDEFAVRNFLRESMLAANGPDYATLGNLARVNRTLIGDPR